MHQCGGAWSECQRQVTHLGLGRSASARDHCRLHSKVKVTGAAPWPPPRRSTVSGILARACNKVLRTGSQDARRGNARACAQARQLLGRSQRAREQELGESTAGTCSIAILASMAAAFSCGCPCAPAAPCTQQRLPCTAAAPAQFGRYFEIEERNTTFLQECRAGAVLFLTVCYIIRRSCSRAARTVLRALASCCANASVMHKSAHLMQHHFTAVTCGLTHACMQLSTLPSCLTPAVPAPPPRTAT